MMSLAVQNNIGRNSGFGIRCGTEFSDSWFMGSVMPTHHRIPLPASFPLNELNLKSALRGYKNHSPSRHTVSLAGQQSGCP